MSTRVRAEQDPARARRSQQVRPPGHRPLLRQLMAGALTAIAVPSATFEAARDLARAREQVRADLMRCRHRVSKLLLRHGRVYDRKAWTQAHAHWRSQEAGQRDHGRVRARALLLPLGSRHRPITHADSPPARVRRRRAPKSAGTRDNAMGSPNQATPALRHASAGDETGTWGDGVPTPAYETDRRRGHARRLPTRAPTSQATEKRRDKRMLLTRQAFLHMSVCRH